MEVVTGVHFLPSSGTSSPVHSDCLFLHHAVVHRDDSFLRVAALSEINKAVRVSASIRVVKQLTLANGPVLLEQVDNDTLVD